MSNIITFNWIKLYDFVLYFLGTGNTVIKAVNVLKEHRVSEDNIILSNLFTTPIAAHTITTAFPLVCFSLRYNYNIFFLDNWYLLIYILFLDDNINV